MDRDPVLEDSDDSDDEDYVLGCEDNLPSEEENDGEPEDDLLVDGDTKSGCKRKSLQTNRRKKRTKVAKGRRHLTALEDDDDDDTDKINEGKTKFTEEDEKKKTDSLWSDFLQDADVSLSPKQSISEVHLNSSVKKDIKIKPPSEAKKAKMVTITQVFDYAGEEVKVTKEVPVDSAAAKNSAGIASAKNSFVIGQQTSNVLQPGKPLVSKESCKPSTGGGISAILGQIGKKSKIGTLEKSKLDWERFKSSQNLHADIEVHNRGRDGFLEKQDFLQRADIRQFEIEKQLRKTTRSTR